jgi:hypothetical protein
MQYHYTMTKPPAKSGRDSQLKHQAVQFYTLPFLLEIIQVKGKRSLDNYCS